jgi:hypothetical protein
MGKHLAAAYGFCIQAFILFCMLSKAAVAVAAVEAVAAEKPHHCSVLIFGLLEPPLLSFSLAVALTHVSSHGSTAALP